MQVNTHNTFLHGQAEVASSRYFALYIAQAGWLALGFYLLSHAYWPSSCKPHDFVTLYSCSGHLAETHGWIEAALMTWLWSTPMLVSLEILRRFNKPQRR